jgi:carboxynorspermidine decarboxylase
MAAIANEAGCRVLFSIKSLSLSGAIHAVAPFTHGFSASSLFEARFSRDCCGSSPLVNYVSPIVRNQEIEEVAGTCDRISLNSLSQLRRYENRLANACEIGIRLNPKVSFVDDARYNPCRRNAKLGVPLDQFRSALSSEAEVFSNVSGIHLHSNCDSDNSGQLVNTTRTVESALGDGLRHFRWFNVGGGYDFLDDSGVNMVVAEFQRLSGDYGLEIVIEPGASIARSAGCYVSTVEDIVLGEDFPIAILDTSVNHWPEVFEYQFEPDVERHVENGRFTYLLAGCSCLAGDLFGVYSFDEPLDIGSRVVFRNAGAYSIVKANMFNGINLPNIYLLKEKGELVLVKQFTYEDFASRCGVDARAIV